MLDNNPFRKLVTRLEKAYFWLEGKYYKALDWLEERGVPAYEYWVNPLEKRGVSSFPVTVSFFSLSSL